LPASKNLFQIVDRLPGKNFDPSSSYRNSIVYTANGNVALLPGDYGIPAMTYCMLSSGSSPSGHSYLLGELKGARATIIRDLNSRALPKFSYKDVQILSWSLQNGLSYEEMTLESQRIVDEILPERKAELKESFLKSFAREWDILSDKSHGLLPQFDETSETFLNEMSDLSVVIREMRNFRERVQQFGNDYSKLSEFIQINHVVEPPVNIRWNKISNNIYARFVTKGHYQDIGEIQLRVLHTPRKIATAGDSRVEVDLNSLIADPQSPSVQPLSFSALYGANGVLVLPAIADAPLLMTALVAAVITATVVDWDDFSKLADLSVNIKLPELHQQIDLGNRALQKAHDELEKPLRDLKIIDRKMKNTSTNEKSNTREYKKSGGEKALEEDFDKINAPVTPAKDGRDMKILPDGKKVVKRPALNDAPPTLELQPENTRVWPESKLRIKIRYGDQ
jgi:hypothetical protein